MPSCTFFGHRKCPSSIMPKLRAVLVHLIEEHNVNLFYVGNQGDYDTHVYSVLQELSLIYPHIHYTVVMAYLPQIRGENPDNFSHSIFPEGIEAVPRRFAISWRNKWMLQKADYVIVYITHSWGGAAQFAAMAQRKKKVVIHLTDCDLPSEIQTEEG